MGELLFGWSFKAVGAQAVGGTQPTDIFGITILTTSVHALKYDEHTMLPTGNKDIVEIPYAFDPCIGDFSGLSLADSISSSCGVLAQMLHVDECWYFICTFCYASANTAEGYF